MDVASPFNTGRFPRRSAASLACAVASLTAFSAAAAQPVPVPDDSVTAHVFATDLVGAVVVAHAPGDFDHLYVGTLEGIIYKVDVATGFVHPTPFLDLSAAVAAVEGGGLLGLAFDPAYRSTGDIYVFYNAAPNPPNDRVLARYRALPGAASVDAETAELVWRFPRAIGHDGGWIGFDPIERFLMLSTGDGGTRVSFDAPNRAQKLDNEFAGKMLRIDVRSGDAFPANPLKNYRVPILNPFVGVPGEDEIWAYGLRNPWRCSFDRGTGDLYIADVGQDLWEEVNVEPAGSLGGRNYGWKCMEADACTGLPGSCACGSPGLTLPVFQYGRPQGRSITGGYVYRGTQAPAAVGRYFFGDFNEHKIYSIRVLDGVAQDFRDHSAAFAAGAGRPVEWISTFGEDAAGELYVCDFNNGIVYRMRPRGTCPGDYNGSGAATVQDIYDFLAGWSVELTGVGAPIGNPDVNGEAGTTVQDLYDFLALWTAGCP